MKLRSPLLLCLLSALVLAACSSSSTRPQPSPLPVFSSAAELREQWSHGPGKLRDALLRPGLAGGSVYAAGEQGEVIRIDAAGRRVWRADTDIRLSGGVASDGGVVLVGGSEGELVALDADSGKLRWRTAVGGEILSLPLIADDLALVRVGDYQIAAYGLTDGKRRWVYQRTQSPLALRSHNGFVRSGDVVLAGFSGGKLVALSLAGGLQRWEATIAQPRGANELERMADVVGEPVLVGEMVCAASFQGRVTCVDRTSGQLRWARDIPSTTGLAADGDSLYVVDSLDAVYSLDVATGSTRWKQEKLGYRQLVRPLVVGTRLVVADAQGYIHVLDRSNGTFVARARADSSGVFAPMLALPNDGFATQTRDGEVIAWSFKR
ncbi:MAG: outer membrane protein assembly factor BamB [Candidatus Dactylopiibacterium carminicum]|nr:MAG: outer membrane protein assembly factor BamB [Candidatus Dactylopiibacterium carminicum]